MGAIILNCSAEIATAERIIFYSHSPYHIIPKKILSPTFTECSPNIHFENKKVGDNIILSPYRRKGVLHWTQNTKKASGA